jgi:hypothetical protein
MSKMKSTDLREIAQGRLSNLIGESVDEQQFEELVTSVVRQWVTYDKHAGLVFDNGNVWLNLLHKGGSHYDVGVNKTQGRPFLPLLRSRDIEVEDTAEMLHRLNLSQSVELTNAAGERFKLWVNPRERQLGIDAAREE